METTASYRIRDLFWEALAIEWRVLRALGQTVAGAAVFVFVQLMNIILYPAALIVDFLGVFLGFEIPTVVGVRRTDDIA